MCSVAQWCPNLCNPMDCSLARLLGPWNFSGKNTGSGFPFPPPGYLPNPGIESMSPALEGGFFTTEPPEKLKFNYNKVKKIFQSKVNYQQNEKFPFEQINICKLYI